MAQQARKPFKDKTFYLDLKFYRNQEDLVKNIQKLGAKVESFLSRSVDYVVTDHEELRQTRIETWSPVTSKSFIFSPSSSMNRHEINLSPFETPSNTSSPAIETKSQVVSRGRALVQKAKPMNKGTTDLLEVCNQWNIKVIQLQKVLGFIAKCRIYTSKKSTENKPPSVQTSGSFYKKLTAPFMKVEDRKGKYRPHYRQFKNLKEIADKKLQHIIRSIQSDVLKPNVLAPLNVGQLSNVLVSSTMQNYNSGNLAMAAVEDKPKAASPEKKHKKAHKTLANKAVEYVKAPQAVKLPHAKKNSWKKKKFCEICCCSYVSIDEHLTNHRHRQFMKDKKNFKVVEKIVAQLPTMSEFLQKVSEESLSSSKQEPETVTELKPRNLDMNERFEEDVVSKDLNQSSLDEDIIDASCPSDYVPEDFPFLNGTYQPKNEHSEEISKLATAKGDLNLLNMYNAMTRFSEAAAPVNLLNSNEQDTALNLSHEAMANSAWLSAQKDINCSISVNYNVKDAETFSAGFPNTQHFEPNSPLVNSHVYIENQNPQYSFSSSKQSTPTVIRKFPFTNFGFGWNSPFCNDFLSQNNFEPNVSCPKDCHSDVTYSGSSYEGSWRNVPNNIGNFCKSLVNDDDNSSGALDLTAMKPCANALVDEVETSIAVAT